MFSLPWVDSEAAVFHTHDPVRIGDWEIISERDDWEPCGETLLAESRGPGYCDAVCLCRPGHENPHIAVNVNWVRTHPHERITSVAKRMSTRRQEPRKYKYPVIMNLHAPEDA